MKNIIDELGFRIYIDKKDVEFYLEIADAAIDDKTGEPCSAFVCPAFRNCGSLQSVEFYRKAAQDFLKDGVVGYKAIRLLTYNEYLKETE